MSTLSMSGGPTLCTRHSPHARQTGNSASPSPACSPSPRSLRTPSSQKRKSMTRHARQSEGRGLSPSAPNLIYLGDPSSPSLRVEPSSRARPARSSLSPDKRSSWSKKRQSSSSDVTSWEGGAGGPRDGLWTPRTQHSTDCAPPDSSGTESETDEGGSTSTNLSPEQEVQARGRLPVPAPVDAVQASHAMSMAVGQTPATRKMRPMSHLTHLQEGQLERRFATHVSMTPPARFGSSATIEESPFSAAGLAATSYPATEARHHQTWSATTIPRSQAFGPLVPASSVRPKGSHIGATDMEPAHSEGSSHAVVSAAGKTSGIRRTWALGSSHGVGHSGRRRRQHSVDMHVPPANGEDPMPLAQRRNRFLPAPIVATASALATNNTRRYVQRLAGTADITMDVDSDAEGTEPPSPSPCADLSLSGFGRVSAYDEAPEGYEADGPEALRPHAMSHVKERSRGSASSRSGVSDASVFGSEEFIPSSHSTSSSLSSASTATASKASPYETPYKRRATGFDHVRASTSAGVLSPRGSVGSAPRAATPTSRSEGRIAAATSLFGFAGSMEVSREPTGDNEAQRTSGKALSSGAVSGVRPVASSDDLDESPGARDLSISSVSTGSDSLASPMFGDVSSRNSSLTTNPDDFDDSGVAFGTPTSAATKEMPAAMAGSLGKQMGLPRSFADKMRQARERRPSVGAVVHTFPVHERSGLANETNFSDGGSSAASSPQIARQSTRVASFPEGLDSPARIKGSIRMPTTGSGSHLDAAGASERGSRGLESTLSASVYMTPQNYKNVRPLATAFMSTGLVSKQRNRTPSGSGAADKTDAHAVPLPMINFSNGPGQSGAASGGHLALREVVAAGNAHAAAHATSAHLMPDTPVKRAGMGATSGAPISDLVAPAARQPPASVLRPTTSDVLRLGSNRAPLRGRSGLRSCKTTLEDDSPPLDGSCASPTLNLSFLGGAKAHGPGTDQELTMSDDGDAAAPHTGRMARSPLPTTQFDPHAMTGATQPSLNAPYARPRLNARLGSLDSRSIISPIATPGMLDDAESQRASGIIASQGTSSMEAPSMHAAGVRPKLLRSKTLGRANWGLQRKSSTGPGSEWPPGASVASVPFGSIGSPVLAPGPIPSTPTRTAAQIKWFEAAQLVTTPSPSSTGREPSDSIALKRASICARSGKGSRFSTSSTPARPTGREHVPPAHMGIEPSHAVGRPRSGETQVGRFDSNFTVLSILGRGEFSEALKAEEKRSGIVYAVKRMKRAFQGPRNRLRCLEEVDILRQLSEAPGPAGVRGHPNIISMVDAWEEDGHLHIQTQLCPHGTLSFFLETYANLVGAVEEPRLWKILAELSAGLGFIHNHNVLHLDLKPANVFITEIGTLKIGDFGLASRWPPAEAKQVLHGAGLDADHPTAGEVTQPVRRSRGSKGVNLEREGDREYIAPEVILEGLYSKAADVFSLGLIMLEATAGVVLPDNGEPWQKLRSDDFSDADMSGYSVSLVRVITAMLSSRPSGRPSVADLLAHPVLRAVQRKMARGLTASELDQLPEFRLPASDSGSSDGSGEGASAEATWNMGSGAGAPEMQRSDSGGSALGLTGVADGDSAVQDGERVVDIRGALIQEDDEEFMADVLAEDPDVEARSVWSQHLSAWSPSFDAEGGAGVGLGIGSASGLSPLAEHFLSPGFAHTRLQAESSQLRRPRSKSDATSDAGFAMSPLRRAGVVASTSVAPTSEGGGAGGAEMTKPSAMDVDADDIF